MSLLQQTKNLCKQYHITPLRRRGQNFLINPFIVEKVIAAAGLDKNDIVIEVGAGLGTLTKQIAKQVKKVVAIEIDKKLVQVLSDELCDYKNVEIVHGDIRDPTSYKLPATSYKIVANLPFNITGLTLRKFLGRKNRPEVMVVIVQKEVGERIIARPSKRGRDDKKGKMNLLAVSVQFYAHPEIIFCISKNNFWPKPKVDSVILKIVPSGGLTSKRGRTFDEKFFQIVKAGFLHSRKYLLNNLATLPLRPPTSRGGRGSTALKNSAIMIKSLKQELMKIFNEIGLSPRVRAQELSVEKWVALVNKLCQ
ncbi:16S rRNA (adenine(1518)-N(6)/adenine(1519)-N(6))-dimethyltransferase RsmA [Patescibacteria group bacterium AH-259-L07]|nr:16S rRNA (adenine(1518)-N(6)/adenine(1519)-N(6))-dimethyltransferase RsmA [Patescibacteria group bacterium AH-259-L07]